MFMLYKQPNTPLWRFPNCNSNSRILSTSCGNRNHNRHLRRANCNWWTDSRFCRPWWGGREGSSLTADWLSSSCSTSQLARHNVDTIDSNEISVVRLKGPAIIGCWVLILMHCFCCVARVPAHLQLKCDLIEVAWRIEFIGRSKCNV